MSRLGGSALKALMAIAIAGLCSVLAVAPRAMAQVGAGRVSDVPQDLVVCTGWHALCTVTDCTMDGDRADCGCYRVNETHIVETAAIQDLATREQTRATCTADHPCAPDEAPVCGAIRDGTYEVDDVSFDWVSTYSYRGWCSLLQPEPVPCDQGTKGYAGDRYWAVCDGAPCTEDPDPADPDRPLNCRCRVQDTPFVGAGGTCTAGNGRVMSSFALLAWDFENNTYRLPMPGYEYVRPACAPLASDPLPPRRDGERR